MNQCTEDNCTKAVRARGLCDTHWMAWRRAAGDDFVSRYGDPVARFWEKVDRRGPDECWPWLANIEPTGYPRYKATHEGVRFTKAHCFAYHICVGPVPPGLVLDHTCHTQDKSCRAGSDCLHRRCVNPAHLEPVTRRENWLRSRTASAENTRKTHCVHGHPLSGDNLIIRSDGGRRCRRCKANSEHRRYLRNQAKPGVGGPSPEATSQ